MKKEKNTKKTLLKIIKEQDKIMVLYNKIVIKLLKKIKKTDKDFYDILKYKKKELRKLKNLFKGDLESQKKKSRK